MRARLGLVIGLSILLAGVVPLAAARGGREGNSVVRTIRSGGGEERSPDAQAARSRPRVRRSNAEREQAVLRRAIADMDRWIADLPARSPWRGALMLARRELAASVEPAQLRGSAQRNGSPASHP